MNGFDFSPASLVSTALALGFASGLNVYLSVFLLGLLSRLHVLTLPPGLSALSTTAVLVASGICFGLSFVVDKIPVLDVVWNVLNTFVRIPAAAVLAYSASGHLSAGSHLLVTAVAAAAATISHTSKTASRLAVTASPEPVTNAALSIGEDGLAGTVAFLAMAHPLAAGIFSALLLVAAAGVIYTSQRLVRKGLSTAKQRFADLRTGGWGRKKFNAGNPVQRS